LAYANNPNDNHAAKPWRIHSARATQVSRILLAYIIGVVVGAGAFYLALQLILQ